MYALLIFIEGILKGIFYVGIPQEFLLRMDYI